MAVAQFTNGVRHVAEHASHVEVCELLGAGHLAPSAEPELVADDLIEFFNATHERT